MIDDQREEAPEETVGPHEVAFDYIKSQFFRVIHVDGATGGLTPQGYLQVSVYSERAPIPKRTVHQISSEGRVGDEVRGTRIGRKAIVRELEASLMMDQSTARSLHEWLGNVLKVYDAAVAAMGSEAEAGQEK